MRAVHMADRDVNANGLRIRCGEWNAAAKAAVLLLHGVHADRHGWAPVAQRLAESRRVVAPDLRGHGESDWASDGYATRSFAGDVATIAGALGLQRCDIVGHSLGGRVAAAYAGLHPEGVRRVVMSDIAPEVAAGGAALAASIVRRDGMPRGFGSAGAALQWVVQAYPSWPAEAHRDWVAHALRPNWAGKLVPRSDPELFWLAGSAGRADAEWLWDMCRRITAPVLLVRARRSPFLDDALVARMRDALPQLQVAEIDSGHFVTRERPEKFAAVVAEFLDR
jgi:pimeloyl-ACP methyl ester carboxylesterase